MEPVPLFEKGMDGLHALSLPGKLIIKVFRIL